jgi:hypothetical protein
LIPMQFEAFALRWSRPLAIVLRTTDSLGEPV